MFSKSRTEQSHAHEKVTHTTLVMPTHMTIENVKTKSIGILNEGTHSAENTEIHDSISEFCFFFFYM